ncbi:protein kinase [Alcaligenes faecalis]|uniref:protein kinase domain-containing protein n=1 Tax=Alcaligenes faecalis TaxID=511 RepID=UPI00165FB370|nr:protein kinase [Alcaligenes faecalis]MCM2558768.1 protein kinase [Alcaligenes faecalis]MCM2622640.1 protein kinase [Alcaligenes faecalis]MCR4142888.1 protein kinase [Alcaligenes faecalis]
MGRSNRNEQLRSKWPNANQLQGWQIIERIGGGGNGDVFRVQRDGQIRALKLLHRRSNNDKKRFHDEVEAMRRCADIAGVLPILESSTDLESSERLWFVTGLATEVMTKLGDQPRLSEVVRAVCAYAIVLTAIHERGISHRDIKPENLFYYGEQWVVGDFGLASFEGKKAVTAERSRLGPLFYMAPEMFNDVKTSDGRSADVYSLAKTLWKLATGQGYPLPGSYTLIHQAFRIGSYLPDQTGTGALDQLISAATAFRPLDRPSMSQFAAELQAWLTPKVEKAMPIKIDIGQHVALLEDLHLNQEADREHLLRQSQTNEQAEARALQKISPFMNELRKSVEISSDALACKQDEKRPRLVISIPGEEKATLELALEVDSASCPMIAVAGRIVLNWHTGAGLKLSLWDSEVRYLGSGSEEASKLDQLCEETVTGLQESLQQALSLSFSKRLSTDALQVIHFVVERQSGLPVGGASIHILSLEGITLAELKTAVDGCAEYTLAPVERVIAFISHAESHSVILIDLHQNNRVTLNERAGASSTVQETSWTGIQGMVGSFSLIHDQSRRTYMYVKGLSVEGGATGAIPLTLGKGVRLKDKLGNRVVLTPRAVIGPSYALDFQRELD